MFGVVNKLSKLPATMHTAESSAVRCSLSYWLGLGFNSLNVTGNNEQDPIKNASFYKYSSV
jgi:hypothetical protein